MSKFPSLVCAFLCAGAAVVVMPAATSRGADWGQPSAAERRIAEELKNQTVLGFIDTPLQDVADTLKDLHEIEIQLDERALQDVGIATDAPVTVDLKGISLRSALRLMLRQMDLTCVV
ncbi:MAG: hypothetical protein ACYTG0_31170, partial [Planctomycetota bacterium]